MKVKSRFNKRTVTIPDKVWKHCFKEAKKDKAWAERKKYDKKFLERASEYTKEYLQKVLKTDVEQLALDKCQYLHLRASSVTRTLGGTIYYIDKPARELWKKLTGRYPKIQV